MKETRDHCDYFKDLRIWIHKKYYILFLFWVLHKASISWWYANQILFRMTSPFKALNFLSHKITNTKCQSVSNLVRKIDHFIKWIQEENSSCYKCNGKWKELFKIYWKRSLDPGLIQWKQNEHTTNDWNIISRGKTRKVGNWKVLPAYQPSLLMTGTPPSKSNRFERKAISKQLIFLYPGLKICLFDYLKKKLKQGQQQFLVSFLTKRVNIFLSRVIGLFIWSF